MILRNIRPGIIIVRWLKTTDKEKNLISIQGEKKDTHYIYKNNEKGRTPRLSSFNCF